MTDKERITELEEEVLHLCSCIEIYGQGLESVPHLVARARKLAGSPSDNQRWEDDPVPAGIGEGKELCDIDKFSGRGASKSDPSDHEDAEPGEGEPFNPDYDL